MRRGGGQQLLLNNWFLFHFFFKWNKGIMSDVNSRELFAYMFYRTDLFLKYFSCDVD